MKLQRKTFYNPIMAVLLSGMVLFGAGKVIVNAQTGQEPDSGLVQEISTKFNLDKSQVQAVFDSYHTDEMAAREKDMQQRTEDRLNQAVTAGEITTEQKQEVLDELTKLTSEYGPESGKDATDAERQANMQKRMDEINAWASSTGIKASYLMGGGPGFGGPGHDGDAPRQAGQSATITPTPSQ